VAASGTCRCLSRGCAAWPLHPGLANPTQPAARPARPPASCRTRAERARSAWPEGGARLRPAPRCWPANSDGPRRGAVSFPSRGRSRPGISGDRP
jgi:hypothetical protein